MPNRIIKESICTSEDINLLTPQEEVFFYRLMVNCDDYGRLDARTPILKAKLYPLKENMKSSDIERYLVKLSSIKPEPLIKIFTNNNIRYLQVAKWEKHQQIRAKRSKYPAYTNGASDVISSDINNNQPIADVTENPIQSESNPNPKGETHIDIINNFTDNDLLKKALTDYLEMRKVIKKPATNRALQLVLKTLEPHADSIKIKMLEQSVIKNWTDVYLVKDEQPKSYYRNLSEA
jgi:hypothetical protein